MKKVSRRTFFSSSLGAAAALSVPTASGAAVDRHVTPSADVPQIIDTNVNLLEWPFRKLKYSDADALAAKLRKHNVRQAWAGSFEALFHKDINGVNIRLAETCRKYQGMFLPFGTVNLAWPDWREDLRRCHEVHRMPGVRIYPIYQTFDLDHPDFSEFISLATDFKMIVQVAGDMEDIRHHHPIVQVRSLNMEPLVDVIKEVPDAKVQLVYWNHRVPVRLLERLVHETGVCFDTSRVEGVGEIGRLIEGRPWHGKRVPVPASRILFGSHAPFFPVEANVFKLFESPLSREQMEAIMNGNAQQFIQAV